MNNEYSTSQDKQSDTVDAKRSQLMKFISLAGVGLLIGLGGGYLLGSNASSTSPDTTNTIASSTSELAKANMKIDELEETIVEKNKVIAEKDEKLTEQSEAILQSSRILEQQVVEQQNTNSELSAAEILANDSERKTDVNSIHAQAEAYSAKFGFYPTTDNIKSGTWTSQELPGLADDIFVDPSGGKYAYLAFPVNCTNENTLCTSYEIPVDLEEDGLGNDDADNDTVDYLKKSLN